jgi:N,N'-diacetyllegionaminate synthase
MGADKILVIAEAGVNHNGDMTIAKQLIRAASEAGADVVKFQTFCADRLVTRSAPKANYQNQRTDQDESQYDMLKRLELTREMHQELIRECQRCRIQFLSTGFDEQSLDLLCELGVTTFKIPSGEITNFPYLQHVGRKQKSVILSTGMSDLDDVRAALVVLENAGTTRDNITVLHCTSEYPAPLHDVNLRVMTTMRERLGVKVGYSDHTAGIEIAIAAAAMGAVVIEKHFTLDRRLPGPDHQASLEPDEFTAMVYGIRKIEKAMGDGIKRCSPSEGPNRLVARKSLRARQAIRAGEIFSAANLISKRPGTGLSPMHWHEIIGQAAKRNFVADELIEI